MKGECYTSLALTKCLATKPAVIKISHSERMVAPIETAIEDLEG